MSRKADNVADSEYRFRGNNRNSNRAGRARVGRIPRELPRDDGTYAAWGNWLDGLGWSTFALLTFGDQEGRSAVRCGDRIVEWLWRATGQRALAFIVGEHGRRTGRFHLHALVSHGDNGHRVLDQEWRSRYGNTGLRRYERKRGAAHYVGKYVLKEAYDRGSYHLSAAGPGWEHWQKLQVRPFIRYHGPPDPEDGWADAGEIIDHAFKKEEALRSKTSQTRAELERNYASSWWVDGKPKTGYQLYLEDLKQKKLKLAIDRVSTVR